MPKERRDRSVSRDRYRVSPFSCSSVDAWKHSSATSLEAKELAKEWEEARCPVCMEHPHNAVLLICSSHEKGCRPYMCDTSHRHSNCLDQFRKQFQSSMALEEDHQLSSIDSFPSDNSELAGNDLQERSEEMSLITNPVSCDNQVQLKIVCPLCRGKIISWIVDEPARCFMNAKIRSCSNETCDFSGIYTDLRNHARKEHPLVCPSEVNPERQRKWRRLERQRDLGDLLSTLNSSFIEDGDADNSLHIDDIGWLPVFFFIRVFQPDNNVRISRWSGTSGSRGQLNSRRRISRVWSENHDLETGSSSRDNDDESPVDFASWEHSDHIPQQRRPDNTP